MAPQETTLFPGERLCYQGNDIIPKEMTLFSAHINVFFYPLENDKKVLPYISPFRASEHKTVVPPFRKSGGQYSRSSTFQI